ncbi:type II toxin-antitoxin system Phd/YefM family antitoxin [Actinoalloteichus hymeniacidonis]|uniref:Prevent-host-death family protein n=1 Tax=Actinoalloteichus hymeniacidonis TaxID=340345 RepID=A0AAC9HMY2_9PSEU|nr:type II toxin-antitoxin system prevent-host-death family antitoxin [Actinoalloteichus hymeniacidonis]AOS62094.1 prevent-host-death family protein [Actinoalloteichus hymeniacidonis]MBB5909884.1 prevent-host-death family protein [Actinoalloteichus hymeniacidonis]
MSQRIGAAELRRDEAAIIRRVEAGESFTVTRDGRPVADLVPYRRTEAARTLGALQREFHALPPVDAAGWERDRRRSDVGFGPDDPTENPWDARRTTPYPSWSGVLDLPELPGFSGR